MAVGLLSLLCAPSNILQNVAEYRLILVLFRIDSGSFQKLPHSDCVGERKVIDTERSKFCSYFERSPVCYFFAG